MFRVVHLQELMLSDADFGFLSCLSQGALARALQSAEQRCAVACLVGMKAKAQTINNGLFTSSRFHNHRI